MLKKGGEGAKGRGSINCFEKGTGGLQTIKVRRYRSIKRAHAGTPLRVVVTEGRGPSWVLIALGGVLRGGNVELHLPCSSAGEVRERGDPGRNCKGWGC